MSLPDAWVDRIFDRLNLTYGHQFLARWDGLSIEKVKAAWAHDLAGFQQSPRSLWWTLENLPERPPNSVEFRALARRAPAHLTEPREQLDAPETKADPERVRAELAKLRAAPNNRGGDCREWARHIVARHRAGDRATPTVLRMAQEALALAGGPTHHEELPWQ